MLPIMEPTPRADIEHGVSCLIEDLKGEQGDQQGDAVQEGGHSPQSDGGNCQQRSCPQQPGTELAVLVLLLCEGLVHQRAHHGVIDSIPNGPDDGQNAHHSGIDAQNIGTVNREDASHQGKGHAAAPVTQHVADPMLGGQLIAGGFLSH